MMPLNARHPGSPPDHYLTPHMVVQGQEVFANATDIVTVPVSRLKDVLEVIGDADQEKLIRALDELVSRA